MNHNAPTSGTDPDVDWIYYVLQDAQYNVLAMLDTRGPDFGERFTYTPYGRRSATVEHILPADFNADGNVDSADYNIFASHFNQTGMTFAQGDATGDGLVDSADFNVYAGYFDATGSVGGEPLCVFGHQGLMHDEPVGLIQNRYRNLSPHAGRFLQRDPIGYPDGMNAYAAYHVMRGGVDPTGLFAEIYAAPAFIANGQIVERDWFTSDDIEVHLVLHFFADCDDRGAPQYRRHDTRVAKKVTWDEAQPGFANVNHAVGPNGRTELEVIWTNAGAVEKDAALIENGVSAGVLIGAIIGRALPDPATTLGGAGIGGLIGTIGGAALELADLEGIWAYKWTLRCYCECVDNTYWEIRVEDKGQFEEFDTNDWWEYRETQYFLETPYE